MRQRQYFIGALLIAMAVFCTGLAFAQTVAIEGPKSAGVGELCVFNLTCDEAVADWQIVPQADFYVDTAKRTLVFSTPKAGNYTIIAATIVDNKPLVLTHACSYGTSPVPNPRATGCVLHLQGKHPRVRRIQCRCRDARHGRH